MKIRPEHIAALTDGEVHPSVEPAVADMVARSPELARMLAAEQRVAELVRQAFPQSVDEPPTAGLAQALGLDGRAVGREPRPEARPVTSHPVLLAVAASLVLAVGVAGGWIAQSLTVRTDLEDRLARIEASEQERTMRLATLERQRNQALDSALNNMAVSWAEPSLGLSGSVTPVETFVDPDGLFCRRFHEEITQGGVTRLGVGIACRVGDGTWRMYWGDITEPGETGGMPL